MKKINVKEERAAVSALALFTVLIFTTILMGAFIIVITKAKSQIMSDAKIQEIYGTEVARADEIYDEVVEKNKLNIWVYDHENQLVKKGETSYPIGTYIKYDEPASTGYNGKWQIIGASDDGKLMLVSSKNVSSTNTSLAGVSGYNSLVNTLNSICTEYVNINQAVSARCITVEDINKITGYNPEHTGVNSYNNSENNGDPYRNGEVGQYGNKIVYSILDGHVSYKRDGESSYIPTAFTNFKLPGETNNISSPFTVNKSTAYSYYPTTLSLVEDNTATIGIAANSATWDMLFKNANYWLANNCVLAEAGYVNFCYYSVNDGRVEWWTLYNTSGTENTHSRGVRAVITLETDFVPEVDV